MISVLLINLDQSEDRLKFQKKQLEKRKISMRRLSAVKSTDLSDIEYESLANGWQRKLRRTEVACFLSHKRAWEYVLKTGKPWLILEDDALLSKKISDILKVMAEKIGEIDYVNLETRYRRKWIGRKSIELISEYKLRRLYQDRNGSAAYVLFPSGAKKLLNRAQIHLPALADAFLSESYELNAWQIYPAAAIQFDQCMNYNLILDLPFKSTITSSDNPKPKANHFKDYLYFKLRRILGQLRMGMRQVVVSAVAEYKKIPLLNIDFKFK